MDVGRRTAQPRRYDVLEERIRALGVLAGQPDMDAQPDRSDVGAVVRMHHAVLAGCFGLGHGRPPDGMSEFGCAVETAIRSSSCGVSLPYAAGEIGLSQWDARVALPICSPRSPSTSSTFFIENGMIFVPRQW